ncbi:MAG: hypothetical protein C4292_06920 [Nitrososphaera sp.]
MASASGNWNFCWAQEFYSYYSPVEGNGGENNMAIPVDAGGGGFVWETVSEAQGLNNFLNRMAPIEIGELHRIRVILPELPGVVSFVANKLGVIQASAERILRDVAASANIPQEMFTVFVNPKETIIYVDNRGSAPAPLLITVVALILVGIVGFILGNQYLDIVRFTQERATRPIGELGKAMEDIRTSGMLPIVLVFAIVALALTRR